jgi:hypothetical protein
MDAKTLIGQLVNDLAEGAKADKAKAEEWVKVKVQDIELCLKSFVTRATTVKVVILALALGMLIGWSCNESRHGKDSAPKSAVTEVQK